jgi:hypothetical protein
MVSATVPYGHILDFLSEIPITIAIFYRLELNRDMCRISGTRTAHKKCYERTGKHLPTGRENNHGHMDV